MEGSRHPLREAAAGAGRGVKAGVSMPSGALATLDGRLTPSSTRGGGRGAGCRGRRQHAFGRFGDARWKAHAILYERRRAEPNRGTDTLFCPLALKQLRFLEIHKTSTGGSELFGPPPGYEWAGPEVQSGVLTTVETDYDWNALPNFSRWLRWESHRTWTRPAKKKK